MRWTWASGRAKASSTDPACNDGTALNTLGARIVVAGTHSGVGKTTIASGLMAALRARGLRVGGAKVGPDFIDPGYHALALGHRGTNLDPWMCGADATVALAAQQGDSRDLLIVEGVMGLFDGAADGTLSSTADVAKLLDAPVVLVVDASSMSNSVAAVVHGYATLDARTNVAAVILNRVGSDSHEQMLRAAIEPLGIPVIGALRRDANLTWRDRHLGLVPVIEQPAEIARALDHVATTIERSCDLKALVALAQTATPRSVCPPKRPRHVASVRIAVAGGPAFSFMYEENLASLAAAGAELVPFDPCSDRALPAHCDGLIAGGGFPEVYAQVLGDNRELLSDVRSHIRAGTTVWAECGGLLWLSERLDDTPMAGVLATRARMTDKLTLGYRSGATTAPSPFGPAGTALRGHEFHYSRTDPTGDALRLEARTGTTLGGFSHERLLASYLHVHLGGAPGLSEAFVRAVATNATNVSGSIAAG